MGLGLREVSYCFPWPLLPFYILLPTLRGPFLMADASCLFLSLSLFSLTSQKYSRDSADGRPCATHSGLSYSYTTCARLQNSILRRQLRPMGLRQLPWRGVTFARIHELTYRPKYQWLASSRPRLTVDEIEWNRGWAEEGSVRSYAEECRRNDQEAIHWVST
ncbi:uncharacterized protein BO66DRAFT_186329 [Aspergillus aculeatinus CBS 121060]|uniref:Uncharacterized protein n=1 Tax=Aspergillus aculeatinus CBS 121060 TaxID=1448322 RepID=A0ACD1GYA2_9EURO|nr:hypothetical protein BO66DRAFT_186329 [Aspergillus aculeatinus CBS 121060]RAH66238.1 hypothetical protein BO66DRAFT_186329 [Aspergillus aculeatinus CBS 121060]